MFEMQAKSTVERMPDFLPPLLTVALVLAAVVYLLAQAQFSAEARPTGFIGYTSPAGENWVTPGGSPTTARTIEFPTRRSSLVPTEFPAPAGDALAYVYASHGNTWLNVFGPGVSQAVGQITDPSSPLLVMSGDKGEAVAAGGVPLVVRWSPDGRFLAFGSLIGQPETLHVASTAGEAESYALREGYAGEIEWSPDGRYLAVSSYVAPAEGTRQHWVYMLDTQDGGYERLFDGCHIRWSPDSRFIAVHRDPGGEEGVWIASADGELREEITGEPRAFPLAWVPD
jgi:hypothetical protein